MSIRKKLVFVGNKNFKNNYVQYEKTSKERKGECPLHFRSAAFVYYGQQRSADCFVTHAPLGWVSCLKLLFFCEGKRELVGFLLPHSVTMKEKVPWGTQDCFRGNDVETLCFPSRTTLFITSRVQHISRIWLENLT